jgi:purine nucleosidase
MDPLKTIIDTDPATGYRFKDVDDGLAILYLLARPDEFEVLGLTAVHGNASQRKTFEKAGEIVDVAGRAEVPVMGGAVNRRDLATETASSRFLAEAVLESPGEVTVLALGPLTNVATAGMLEPSFFDKVGRLVIMGGSFGSPFELNFFKDTAAAGKVLGAPCEKVLISGDLCRQALFTRDDLERLRAVGSRVSEYLAGPIAFWLRFNRVVPISGKGGGFFPWDVVAAVYLRRPEIFGDIEETGLRLREGRLKLGILEPDPGAQEHPVTVPRRLLEPRRIVEEFLEAMQVMGPGPVSPDEV